MPMIDGGQQLQLYRGVVTYQIAVQQKCGQTNGPPQRQRLIRAGWLSHNGDVSAAMLVWLFPLRCVARLEVLKS